MSRQYPRMTGKALSAIAWHDYGLRRGLWGLEPDAWLRARCRQALRRRPPAYWAIVLSWILRWWSLTLIRQWERARQTRRRVFHVQPPKI